MTQPFDGIADDGARRAVVRISAGGQGCGGVLIASNVVLTAAHCVDDHYAPNAVPPGPVGPFPGPNLSISVQPKPGEEIDPVKHAWSAPVEQVHLHPDWPVELAAGDMALVVLANPVPRHEIVPARVAGAFAGQAVSLPAPWGRGRLVGAEIYARAGCAGGFAYTPGYLRFVRSEALLDGARVRVLGDAGRYCEGDSGSPWFTSHWPGYTGGAPAGQVFSVSFGGVNADLAGPRISDTPTSWVRLLGTDRDADGIVAALDNCDTVYNASQNDHDSDGIGDPCDACPAVFEEWKHDRDGDGIIDCLDPCPDDQGNEHLQGPARYGDTDGDGFCDTNDNCPNVFNPDQRNTNHHSEGRWSAKALGDACEPVPVPDADAGPVETLGSWGVSHPWHRNQWLHTKNHSVTVRPQPSRNVGSSGVVVPPDPITTHFRFCQHPDPGNQLATPCLSPAWINDSHLELGLPGAASELQSMPYHRVTMSFAPGQRGASTALLYDGNLGSYGWDYVADAAFWIANDIVDVPPAEGTVFLPGGAASGLDGVMWLHAATTIGHPGGVNLNTGVHLGVDESATAALHGTEQLANRYVALDPEQVTHAKWTRPLQHALPLFLWRVLPDPPRRWRIGADPSSLRGAAELVVPFTGELGTELGVLSLDGQLQGITERIGTHLLASLRTTTHTWLAAAEPHRAFLAEGHPLVVGLEAHGRGLVDTILDDAEAGLLLGEVDRGLSARSSPGAGAWRQGHQAVYSAQLGQVFVIGGRDALGAELGDVGVYELATDSWRRLRTSVALGGTVHAASYSFTERALYLLDRQSPSKLRLMRVNVLSGEVEHLVSLEPSSAEYSLTTELDGRVLLLVSSNTKHQLFRVWEKESGWVFEELLSDTYPVVHPAVVDEHGLMLYRRAAEWEGTRYTELVAEQYPIAQLPGRL